MKDTDQKFLGRTAQLIISLIIIGIIVVGYFSVEKVDIAGIYQAEDSIYKPDYDLTAEISNQGQTTIIEIDRHYFMTTELTFDVRYVEESEAYTFNETQGVDVTYALELQGIANFGYPDKFDELEESYNFTREDENETVILKGHLTHDELDMLDFNLEDLRINQTTKGISINDREFISQ